MADEERHVLSIEELMEKTGVPHIIVQAQLDRVKVTPWGNDISKEEVPVTLFQISDDQ